jgi:hypothetical protein
MAKQYFAVNQIRHGEAGGEIKVFEAGEEVTGLSKEVMVRLWQSGVLREVDPNQVPRDHRDDEIDRLKAQIEAIEAEKKAAEDNPPRDANEIPGLAPNPTPNSPEIASELVGTVAQPLKDEDNKDDSTN